MLSHPFKYVLILAAVITVVSYGCTGRRDYNVERKSPSGLYSVKVDVRVEDEPSLMAGFNEWGKIQFFKGQETLDVREWERKDNFESTFIDAHPVIEWLKDNLLYMGSDQSKQPFLDDIVVLNHSSEKLKYLSVSSDKDDELVVFDLPAREEVTLRATLVSEWLSSDGSRKYSLGYGGTSQSGKEFSNAIEFKQAKPRADGPIVFQILINDEDLQKR